MNRIEVRCEIREYPDDKNKGNQTLIVRNHWNYSDRVILEI